MVHWPASYISTYTLYSNWSITYNIELNNSTWQKDDNLNKNCNKQELLLPDLEATEGQKILFGQSKSLAYTNHRGRRQVKVTGKKNKTVAWEKLAKGKAI